MPRYAYSKEKIMGSQMQRLTIEQRAIRRWRLRRNALVNKIMRENPTMLTSEATKAALEKMGPMPPKWKFKKGKPRRRRGV